MIDRPDSESLDEGAADQALRQHDWVTAERFLQRVLETDRVNGKSWLERFAAEARHAAASGDAVAEFVVGNFELLRWTCGLKPAEPCLRSALESFMRAGEATGNVTVIHQVHHWYSQARELGCSFPDVEEFIEKHPVP